MFTATDLSDFIEKTYVLRTGTSAKIIVDIVDGNPIPLYRFETDASYSDFEIKENGYQYYKLLVKHLSKNAVSGEGKT